MIIFANLLLGWMIADFLSGFFHWIEDRFITANTPFLGGLVGAPNELHHAEPSVFLGAGFLERNWTTWTAVLPIAFLWVWLVGFSWVFLGALAGGVFANEVHAWSHRRRVPSVVRALQRSGIWQSRSGHLRHHRGAQNSDYCVITDWLNPWLELIGLWRLLDRAFGKSA